MNHFRGLGTILAVFCACLVPCSVAALANRVFVSARSGNDANTCDSILAPCQTFAGAVTKLNPGGEAIVLDSGGYGKVTITQSLTIEAPAGVTAFVHPSSGDAITINAGGGDLVVLRGLVLNGGSGYGIKANTVGALHVENCVISGFSAAGLQFNSTGKLYVKDTISRQSLTGLEVHAGRGMIDHCRFEGNGGNGVFVTGDIGPLDVTVRDSVSANNVLSGFNALSVSQSTFLSVYQCLAANNSGDGFVASNTGTAIAQASVANSSISENEGVGLHNAGTAFTVFVSLGNNFVHGNPGGETSGTITTVTAK